MWYTLGSANTLICPPAHGGRAGHPGDRSPVCVRLDRAPLPAPPCPGRAATDDHHGARAALPRADGAPHSSCRSSARPRGAAVPRVTPPDHGGDGPPWGLRGPASAVAPQAPDVRPAPQPGDAGAGRRGEGCRGSHPAAGQRRSPAGGPPPLARVVAAGPTLAHPSRSRLGSKKKRRAPVLQRAMAQPTWALGFGDAVWWRRLAQPTHHAWTEAAAP